MVAVYSIAIFLSAGLLFLVQPMVAKIMLPMLGGSPAVWNTCMVFFQVALLGGYVYAHLLTRRLPRGVQVVLHACVLGLGLWALPVALPVAMGGGPETGESPTLWLLTALALTAGLPFFAVASAGPLLQRWFSRTGHKNAGDPYFLYAASNAGSMLGLVAYPLVIERAADLDGQARYWSFGFGVFALLAVVCGVIMARSKAATETEAEAESDAQPVTWARRGWWVFLAFVPSSLLLGVTQHLTTDVAAVPLLWIVPLLVYLLSFVIVFAGGRVAERARSVWAVRATPLAVLALSVTAIAQARDPIAAMVVLHIVSFFILCMLCHGRLVEDRPAASRLTEFYLFMSIGGALGGVFNALIAPVAFEAVHEYPIVIALACLAMPALRDIESARGFVEPFLVKKVALGAAVAGFVAFGLLFLLYVVLGERVDSLLLKLLADEDLARQVKMLLFALPIGVLVLWARVSPPALAAVVGCAMLFASGTGGMKGADLVERERTFFGVHSVYVAAWLGQGGQREGWTALMHGTTLHGIQPITPQLPTPPTSYYHITGPLGDAMDMQWTRYPDTPLRLGLVGLGVGSTAAYARPIDDLKIFEIDPEVVRIARDAELFTYVSEAEERGVISGVHIGDGRLEMRKQPDASFDVLIFDAFSSDSIPIHLITQEAIAEYRQKLAPGGLMLFHVSNRHLDLAVVLGTAAEDLGLAVRAKADSDVPPVLKDEWKQPSVWVVMAEEEQTLSPLLIGRGWLTQEDGEGVRVRWTDSYSNILQVLKW